jgi:hypothetical protein
MLALLYLFAYVKHVLQCKPACRDLVAIEVKLCRQHTSNNNSL